MYSVNENKVDQLKKRKKFEKLKEEKHFVHRVISLDNSKFEKKKIIKNT